MGGMSGEGGGWTGGGHGIGGGAPGLNPGGNNGSGSSGSNSSSNSGNSGPTSSIDSSTSQVSQGRRDSATQSFNGLTEAASIGLGLTDRGPSELGQIGWEGSGNKSREAAANIGEKAGAEMAMGIAGLNTVGNLASNIGIAGLGLGVKGFETAAKAGMTADQARGFQNVQSQKTGLAGWGPSAVGAIAGPMAGLAANLGISALDASRQASYAQSRYGIETSQGRRDNATNSFSGNNGSGSSRPVLATSPGTNTTPTYWQPASYGFGTYDSHLKGLLS